MASLPLLFSLLLLCKVCVSLGSVPQWYACSEVPGEHLDSGLSNCIPAVVPGTALQAMLLNGTFASVGVSDVSELYYDDRLNRLPDISETGSDFFTFWYVVDLPVPPRSAGGSMYSWLTLRGINYRATVTFEGQELHPVRTHPAQGSAGQQQDIAGMFRRWTLQIPGSGAGRLAVRVTPPDFPGVPNVGQGGNHDIAKNAGEMQFSAGWDWIQGTPDRNTGLWDKVSVEYTEEPFRVAHITMETLSLDCLSSADGCLVADNVSANLQFTAAVYGSQPFRGVVVFSLIERSTNSSVYQCSSSVVMSEDPVVCSCVGKVSDVQLWWPHTHGEPYLYTLSASLQNESDAKSQTISEASVSVGIRVTENFIDTTTQGQAFRVNGVRVFIEGGNWIATDQLLRFTSDSQRYDAEVRMHQRMGMNLIRVWGGGITERPEFYDACDRYGVMVMQEFWMTGDNNGRWAGNHSWPLDHSVYKDNALDMILMVRHHPSLLFWCGGNEIYPPGLSPPPDILDFLESTLAALDPHRFFITSSMANYSHFNASFALAPQDGPYGMLALKDFGRRNPGMKYPAAAQPISFQPELGSVSTPIHSNLQRFLSPDVLAAFPASHAGLGSYETSHRRSSPPVHPVWAYHKYLPFTDANGTDHIYTYGAPQNSSEYAFRAQLAQYVQFRALFESFQQYAWEFYAAVLFWKSQSPWPTFRGAFYDYWIAETGGFWGVRDATQPLKLQLRLEDLALCVVNKSPHTTPAPVLARVEAFDSSGTLVHKCADQLFESVKANSVVWLSAPLDWPEESQHDALPPVYFFRFSLLEGSGDVIISQSWYWLSDPRQGAQNLTSLGYLRDTTQLQLEVHCAGKTAQSQPKKKVDGDLSWSSDSPAMHSVGQSLEIQVGISNPNQNKLAFAVRTTPLVDSSSMPSGCRCGSAYGIANATGPTPILPVWRSEDYLTLLPMESTIVSIDFDLQCACDSAGRLTAEAASSQVRLEVTIDGWNVQSKTVTCAMP